MNAVHASHANVNREVRTGAEREADIESRSEKRDFEPEEV
jgi:hypothetical protein